MAFRATPINDDYHYGVLGTFQIIIRTKDDFINITKLCTQGGKDFSNWKKSEGAKRTLGYYDKTYMGDCPSKPKGSHPQEYKCLDITNSKDLAGIPIDQVNILRGTYLHIDVAIHVAQWISNEFAFKVSSIVREYYRVSLKLANEELTQKNMDLTKQLCQMEMRMNRRLDEAEERNKERHDELLCIIKAAVNLLKEEDAPKNRECLFIYRLKTEPEEVLHIHAGKKTSFRLPNPMSCSYFFLGESISNAKRILRFLKDRYILPRNGSSSCYRIEDPRDRKKVFDLVDGINREYKNISGPCS